MSMVGIYRMPVFYSLFMNGVIGEKFCWLGQGAGNAINCLLRHILYVSDASFAQNGVYTVCVGIWTISHVICAL